MKKMLLFLLVVLLLRNSTLADVQILETTYTEIPLSIQSIATCENESLLFAGRSVDILSLERFPRMIILDTKGQLLWKYDENISSSWEEYISACFKDERTIISLLQEMLTIRIDLISKDKTVNRGPVFPLAHIRNVVPNQNGFLFYGNPKPEASTRIIQTDPNGKVLWEIEFDEYLIFNQIINHTGTNYFLGYKIIGSNDDFTSVIVAISENGRIVWQHVNKENMKYICGDILEDGEILVAGTSKSNERFLSLNYYSNEKIVWKNSLSRSRIEINGLEILTGNICSITSYDNCFLVACEGICDTDQGVIIFILDKQGNATYEVFVPTTHIEILEGCRFLQLKEKTILAIYGMTNSFNNSDWEKETISTISDSPRGVYLITLSVL